MSENSAQSSTSKPKRKHAQREIWHFKPELPLKQAPYFELPFSFTQSLKYLLEVWGPVRQRFLLLILAIAIWTWFTPSLERAASFQLDWILEIALRNLVIVVFVAGGLHLLLYTFSKQGDDERFDTRPLAKNSKSFHFGNQIWDNVFWTLCSSVPIGTLCESVMLWAYANGHATLITFTENLAWFIGLMLIVPVWSGFHFYWYHRLGHLGPCYKWVHSWHHKNVNTGPWSGHAMHPVEHLFLYSDIAIYFLIASHPIHMIFNAMLHTVAGPTSHCGYHRVKLTKHFSLQLGDFMHQLHHRFIDCNYGSYETPWDKLFGSFHDGTPEGDQYIRQRSLNIYRSKTQS